MSKDGAVSPEQYLDNIRHSCAHLLAQAVLELYPDTLITIGPADKAFPHSSVPL